MLGMAFSRLAFLGATRVPASGRRSRTTEQPLYLQLSAGNVGGSLGNRCTLSAKSIGGWAADMTADILQRVATVPRRNIWPAVKMSSAIASVSIQRPRLSKTKPKRERTTAICGDGRFLILTCAKTRGFLVPQRMCGPVLTSFGAADALLFL